MSNGYSADRQQITYMSDFSQQARVSRRRAPATPSVKSAKRPLQLKGFPVCLSNNPVDARCVTNLSTFVQTKRLLLAAERKTVPSAWRHPVCKGVRGRKSPSGRGRHRWWAGRCEGTQRAGPGFQETGAPPGSRNGQSAACFRPTQQEDRAVSSGHRNIDRWQMACNGIRQQNQARGDNGRQGRMFPPPGRRKDWRQ